MKHDNGHDPSTTDPPSLSAGTRPDPQSGDARSAGQRHPMVTASDAEKYRWMRAHRGNFAIVEALAYSDRDADFDNRIEAEMRMSAAGLDSYRSGASLPR
jgi:hypothetical protein